MANKWNELDADDFSADEIMRMVDENERLSSVVVEAARLEQGLRAENERLQVRAEAAEAEIARLRGLLIEAKLLCAGPDAVAHFVASLEVWPS